MTTDSPIQVEFNIDFQRGRRGRKVATTKLRIAAASTGRLHRVTRLMALAIKLDGLVRAGAIADYANIACVGHVTRGRVTQIMNLTHLAPDIQEQLLDLPKVLEGRDRITERDLRPIAATADWTTQRRLWKPLARECMQRHGSGVSDNNECDVAR